MNVKTTITQSQGQWDDSYTKL